ncbi:acetate/propionate family kinase [Lentzea sp. E54]|uniref:acetate/propionate family kinase n=1 Tax=Lentzea xerophila TaxID=3435883 RepID=UPI003DA2D951
MSTVLTVNAGSNSLKAHLVDAAAEEVIASAEVEQRPDSDEARQALDDLLDQAGEVSAVGHRLVHGGPDLRAATVVDDNSLAAAQRAGDLAPLHVPPALALLEVLRERLAGVPHVLCPDTAFHSGLPEVAATYPLPAEWRKRYGLRRYGFHGLSYRWALDRTAELLRRPAAELSVLMTHLGGGCSVCAVRDGRSADTSMGFTPLEGVPMSKRSGSVDPGMLLWLLRQNHLDLDAVEHGLNKESGLLGLSGGLSGDTRDLVAAAGEGNTTAALALQVFAHRVRRELAAAATSLDRLDALVFTGEIGWDQPEVRADVVAGLSLLGVSGDLADPPDDDGRISRAGVPVLVVRPREELQLCRDTMAVISSDVASV